MPESIIYLDTSAYLNVLLKEPGHQEINKKLKSNALCSSTLLLIEAERSLVRLSRQGDLSLKNYESSMSHLRQDVEIFLLRDLTEDLCLKPQFPAVRLPRSNDLVHLRTALWFQNHYDLRTFVSCDEKQIKAAEEMGLPV